MEPHSSEGARNVFLVSLLSVFKIKKIDRIGFSVGNGPLHGNGRSFSAPEPNF